MTPRTIVCPNCHALVGNVYLQYVETDVAEDLARRVPLCCAERIDAACAQLTEVAMKALNSRSHSTKSPRQIDAELAELAKMLKSGLSPEEVAEIAKQRRLGQP